MQGKRPKTSQRSARCVTPPLHPARAAPAVPPRSSLRHKCIGPFRCRAYGVLMPAAGGHICSCPTIVHCTRAGASMRRRVSGFAFTLVALATSFGCAPVLSWRADLEEQQVPSEALAPKRRHAPGGRRTFSEPMRIAASVTGRRWTGGWAHQDPTCSPRIERAENGDTLALTYPPTFYQDQSGSSR